VASIASYFLFDNKLKSLETGLQIDKRHLHFI